MNGEAWAVDRVIRWPNRLRQLIGALQELNPDLGLLAIDGQYLAFARAAADDVVRLKLPDPVSERLIVDLTDLNREELDMLSSGGTTLRTGPRRIERAAHDELVIRPLSPAVQQACAAFAHSYQTDPSGAPRPVSDRLRRIVPRWGVMGPGGAVWEVDFGYLPSSYLRQTDGSRAHPRLRIWRTVPIGTICYIDAHDLPLGEHFARAQTTIEAGAGFAVIGDLVAGNLKVFRADSIQTFENSLRLPEMDWCEVPVHPPWALGHEELPAPPLQTAALSDRRRTPVSTAAIVADT